jgi:hypothetical protein
MFPDYRLQKLPKFGEIFFGAAKVDLCQFILSTTITVYLQEIASSFCRFAAKDFRLGEAEHVDEPLRAEDDVTLKV